MSGVDTIVVTGASGFIGAHVVKVQFALCIEGQGLRLDAPQDRRSAPLEPIGMRLLTRDVLIAALAMGEEGEQVALCPAGYKEPRSLAQTPGSP